MNAEDAVLAKEIKGKRKRDEGKSNNHDKKKVTQSSGQAIGKKKELLFPPLIMPIEQVLMQIRDNPSLQWPKPISTPVERRDKTKYCRFHQNHRHRIDECRHLKDQVETLIWQGKLQKYAINTKPHRYQQKDDQDRTLEVGDSKPPAGEKPNECFFVLVWFLKMFKIYGFGFEFGIFHKPEKPNQSIYFSIIKKNIKA